MVVAWFGSLWNVPSTRDAMGVSAVLGAAGTTTSAPTTFFKYVVANRISDVEVDLFSWQLRRIMPCSSSSSRMKPIWTLIWGDGCRRSFLCKNLGVQRQIVKVLKKLERQGPANFFGFWLRGLGVYGTFPQLPRRSRRASRPSWELRAPRRVLPIPISRSLVLVSHICRYAG